jgi:(1->4)-alpha-D-glucan 1-alpha-D-glucosylmutase
MPQRTAPGLVASYRIQLRNGVTLDMVRDRLPWLVELGISHVYLSPLFSAAAGSTHGYDVIDPNRVDPALGGEEAFQALAQAARDAGLGIILDIVPNHMAFTPDNPHVADLMRHGRESRFAPLFDIDWDKGPLHFPVLDAAPADLLARGDIAMAGDADTPALRIYDQPYALRDTALARRLAGGGPLGEDDLAALLAEQHWRVDHWNESADAIVHRRFFNIASLIGVRQEDPEVFAFTHRWIIGQVRAGRVQGLRVDHVDGLARPGSYLRWLREAVGVLPVWVEKIVKPGESIPASWPVEGMSGYEFMTPLTCLLTSGDGLDMLRGAAKDSVPGDYAASVRAIRRELLLTVFTPEVERVTNAALDALAADKPDAPAVQAAIMQLATHWPVYRSYAADGLPLGPAFTAALDAAKADRLPSAALATVFHLLAAPDDPLARLFAARFEQLTGALTAKSEEDTAFYRSVAYLPFCEVGAVPDLGPIDSAGFTQQMSARAATSPCALNGLSTHDTKRSADARAAIIALTWLPDLGARLYRAAREHARARDLDERWGIYALQTALIMLDEPERETRIAEHIAKAMRESKDASSYEAPALEREERASALVMSLVDALRSHALWSGQDHARFTQTVETLVLAQTALQLTAPGIPDIYQGTEVTSRALTDPDNRRPVDWDGIAQGAEGLDARKLALTRKLLALRRERPDLMAMGSYSLVETEHGWTVRRSWQDQQFSFDIERPTVAAIAMDAATG